MFRFLLFTFCVLLISGLGKSYSAYEDARIIRAFMEGEKPQPPKDHAKVARTLVHKSKWAATGTISTDERVKGFPMVNIISIADSAVDGPSTGNIYFLLTTLDFTGQDIKKNNQVTFMMSNDEDESCSKDHNIDPMEPICARVILSGKVVELDETSEEYAFAENAFVSRHPAAVNWKKAHTFFLCKLKISNIYVLDWYGGPHYITAEEYYKATPDIPSKLPRENFVIKKEEINEDTNKPEVHIKINKDKYKVIKIEL